MLSILSNSKDEMNSPIQVKNLLDKNELSSTYFRKDEDGWHRVVDDQLASLLIRLFSDSIIREILGAMKNKLLTTRQITLICKSSETTTYRKIKLLMDYGIIREKGFLLSKGGGRAHFYYSILGGMRLIFDKETSLFIKMKLPES